MILEVTANAFLYHMVRNLAGSLMAVGKGERETGWIDEVLRSRDRGVADITAAASGLYFFKTRYPSAFKLPSRIRPFPWRLSAT